MKTRLSVALFLTAMLSANPSYAQSGLDTAKELAYGLLGSFSTKAQQWLSKTTDDVGVVEEADINDDFAQEISNKVQVSDLSFKSVMRTLYAGRMTQVYVDTENEADLNQMPHIGLTDSTEIGESLVAFMHPVLEYENTDGQSRYLVAIEKVSVNEDGGLITCHVCSANMDLYIFKPSSTGGYQLVSRTPEGFDGIGGSWGRSYFDVNEIEVQPLGRNLMGAVTEVSYCSTGTCESAWMALHLSESDDIGSYHVSEAGADTSGMYDEGSPLAYSYESTADVINNGGKYYPIQLHFTGDMPIDDSGNIQYVDYVKTVNFDPNTKSYQ